MATLGLSKVFILDKYFTELQKYWHTERKLQDTSSSNEASSLHQRLRSLSSELVTLRSRLHCSPPPLLFPNHPPPPPPPASGSGGSSGDTLCEAAGVVSAHQRGGSAPSSTLFALTAGQRLAGTDTSSCLLSRVSAGGSTGGSVLTGRADQASDRPANDLTQVNDLAHAAPPLTEHTVIECLHARFQDCRFFTSIGPILLAVNAYSELNNALTLSSVKSLPECAPLRRVVTDVLRQQSETGYPQAIILSGASGSGKTYMSMLLLRYLLEEAGGGAETDTFKHLLAAFTVLRSLGTAKTFTNNESSRIGHFIEAQATDGALYRTKIHCYFLDQSRVVAPLANEKNYHIFYQMLSGLTAEELGQLRLTGHSTTTLNYLRGGDTRQCVREEARRLKVWRQCLQVLGIPPADVFRVLAACLLLGNIEFSNTSSPSSAEFSAVADLLGVSAAALETGLTSRTRLVRRQQVKSQLDAVSSRWARDCLARALYCRTVATIVRRANSLKPSSGGGASTVTGGGAAGGTPSSSDDSHALAAAAGGGAGSVGGGGSAAVGSMNALNCAVRRAAGFVGILDMFGFEDPQPAHLEHLCVNLCSETMQHFYNTHVFKSSLEVCREEGIQCSLELEYTDNVPCIDLISSLRSGLLSMLDAECVSGGNASTFVERVRSCHSSNSRLRDLAPAGDPLQFAVHHYAGTVTYSGEHFIERNRDVISDDIVCVFDKLSCQFGFASHLFSAELRAFAGVSAERKPRGVSVRISPTAQSDLLSGDEPATSLTQDFHARLHNLLRTLVHAKPHFIRCVSANDRQAALVFERTAVMRQIRALHVLETVQLMATGFPHRQRFRAFLARYRCLVAGCRASCRQRVRTSCQASAADCRLLLQPCACRGGAGGRRARHVEGDSWAAGERHIFLTERCRQRLELEREERREAAACTLQIVWRARRLSSACGVDVPDLGSSQRHIQQTCALFGLQLEQPPPLPPARTYTVTGNSRLAYPQARLMLTDFPERDGRSWLLKGESVTVLGASPSRRGHLLVQHGTRQLHVPHQLLQLPTM